MSICLLNYAALRLAFNATANAQHSVRAVKIGSLTIMSGITQVDSCASFGHSENSWNCPSKYYAHPPGQGSAYRLWVLVTSPAKVPDAYKLVDLPIEQN